MGAGPRARARGALLGWGIALFAVLGGIVALVGYAMVMSFVGQAKEVVDVAKQAKAAWDDPYA